MRLIATVKKQRVNFDIELAGKKVNTKHGEPYGTIKAKTYTLSTPAKAQAKYDELVAARREEGYRSPGEIDPPRIAIARNPALEAAIREDRAEVGPYLVYADWLQAQGSPFGEAIVLASRKQAKQAEKIVKQLGLPHPDFATYGWRHGFWQWLRLENSADWMDDSFDAAKLAQALFASPLCAALEELRIGILRWDHNEKDVPAVLALAGKQAWAKDLPRLHLGDVSDDIDMAHHVIGDIGKLITKTFPRLQRLKLHSGQQTWRGGKETFGVAGLELPELTELVVETCAMSRKRMKALADAKLPALERLELWFGDRREEATATLADIMPVLDGMRFPKLRHLGLRNTSLDADLVRLVPGSAVAGQLESLDLSMGTLNDAEAGELAASAARLPRLRVLNVDDTFVTKAGLRVLAAAFPQAKVTAKSPKDADDDDDDGEPRRYVSVSE